MSTSRHDATTREQRDRGGFRDDLKSDPAIGQSKGAFATGDHPQTIKAENTSEGDVDNDSTVTDGVPEQDRARTNS